MGGGGLELTKEALGIKIISLGVTFECDKGLMSGVQNGNKETDCDVGLWSLLFRWTFVQLKRKVQVKLNICLVFVKTQFLSCPRKLKTTRICILQHLDSGPGPLIAAFCSGRSFSHCDNWCQSQLCGGDVLQGEPTAKIVQLSLEFLRKSQYPRPKVLICFSI